MKKVLQIILLIVLVILVLVGVAFFTLFERKLLGYIQLRKGPNKVGVGGVVQPFADAIKLFSKEHAQPNLSNYTAFLAAPVMSLALSLILWATIPSCFNILSFDLSVLFFLACLGLSVYTLLIGGWSSNCKYSLIGALRSIAQTVSYEVSLILILLSFILLSMSFNWLSFKDLNSEMKIIWLFPLLTLIWFISCLAETNRTPFDFAEGESELVSGYNTEYSSGGFALYMLSEYSSILFMSLIFVILFLQESMHENFIYFTLLAYFYVWVRGTLPRFRYDLLMKMAWKIFLPISLLMIFFPLMGLSYLI